MRSLLVKLAGTFLVVILIGAVANSFIVSRFTDDRFDRYVSQTGAAWATQIAPAVAGYYERSGSWQGVESVLESPWLAMVGQTGSFSGPPMRGMMGAMGSQMEPQMGSEMGHMMSGDMWTSMGLRILVVDRQGTVVADSGRLLVESQLAAADLAGGTPVEVDGQRVGAVLVLNADDNGITPAGSFLQDVRRATWLASLAAAAGAVVLGVLLSRQIVAPIRRVTAATQRIAAGDLEQRVPVTGQDEVGELAATFNQMADALASAQTQRQNMIADIAHELRTPLSVIQANLEAMLDGVIPTSPEEIALLHEETTTLARLIADLRLLSLADAGQLHLEQASQDPATLIRRAVDQFRLLAEAEGVHLDSDIEGDMPPVYVDADRVTQIVGNLVHNALRHTPTGGQVTVRAHCDKGRVSRESAVKDFVVVEVADTGPGLDPVDLPSVFDRFYRADRSRNRRSGGAGLGLAIVKQLVEAHGGQVWAESQPGQGATFAFTLPTVA